MKTNYVSGVVYPLAWLTMLQKIETVAELKVVACVLGYDGVVGIDTEALNFVELLHRTGLSKRGLQDGIKKAIKSGFIRAEKAESSPYAYVFCPGFQDVANLATHDHDIMINHDNVLKLKDSNKEHDHGADFAERKKCYAVLLAEFAMTRALRVADDICFSPKYTLDKLHSQIRYAKWETKRGKGPAPARPVRNAAGNLVARLKTNEGPPPGFSLLQALVEDEGWNRENLYWAIYDGDIELQEIKDSFEYSSWVYEHYEAEQEGVAQGQHSE